MLTYLLNIAFAIAATVLFIQAPEHYDYTYCQALMWVFIAQNATGWDLSSSSPSRSSL